MKKTKKGIKKKDKGGRKQRHVKEETNKEDTRIIGKRGTKEQGDKKTTAEKRNEGGHRKRRATGRIEIAGTRDKRCARDI